MKENILKAIAKFMAVVIIVSMITAESVTYAVLGKAIGSIEPVEKSLDAGSIEAADGFSDKQEDGETKESENENEKEPEGSGDKPEGSEKEPEGSGDKPEGSEKEPEGSEKEPEGSGDKPEGSEKEPEESEIKEEIKLEKPYLSTASKTNSRIKISWGKVKGAAGYKLFRSTKKDGGYQLIYKTKRKYRYIDEACGSGQVYYYRLTAYTKGYKQCSDSKIVKGRSLEKAELTKISNLSGSKKLTLYWKRVKGAAGYQVERADQNGKYRKAAVVKGKKTFFDDKGLKGGETYTYRVYAVDKNGGRGNRSGALSQMAIDADKKMIALTYDDGPSLYTPIVLDALEKYGAHATFFVVGNRINQYSASIRRESALGCEIGNHTYDHNILTSLSMSQVQSVLSGTSRAVKEQAGVDIHVMRPPGGSYTASICEAAGMPVVLWSIDTLDWKTRSTSATIQCIKQKAYDGAIVLMHDLHQPTANAADEVIRYLKAAGYQMVTVSEMAAYRGGMTAGMVYSQFRK